METSHAQRIVATARLWRGTRFAHQGRRRAQENHPGGVDCLGLLAGVAHELGLRAKDGSLLSAHDVSSYSKSPDGALLQARLAALLFTVKTNDARPGDIALFAMDGQPQHLAILTPYAPGILGMIHAYAPARKVVEHRMDESWRKNLVSLYRCP